MSARVSDAVLWAMEIRVDARPQSVGEFLDALEAASGRSAALPDGPVAPPDRPAARAAQPAPRTQRPATKPTPAPVEPAPRTPSPRAADRPTPDPDLASSPPDEAPFDVTVQGDRLHWPNQCACCFEPADTSYPAEHTGGNGPFGLFEETRRWDVPYCSACLDHVRAANDLSGPGMGPLAAGPLAGVMLGGPIGLLVGLGVAAASLVGSAKKSSELEKLIKPSCVALGPAVAYRGWDGDMDGFTFASRPFTEAFLRENADKIVA